MDDMPAIPPHLLYPLEVFGDRFHELHERGMHVMQNARIAVVGLARNCAGDLRRNLETMALQLRLSDWRLHIETNDNADDTDQVLADFCRRHRQATFTSQRLNRQQYSTEFAGRRTHALAEYRDACQRWVRANAADSDYTLVVDWDMRGGWSQAGLHVGFGTLDATPIAFGMASVSLLYWFEALSRQASWVQYDAWALRLNSTFDDYTAGIGGWKHGWLPPVGSPAVPVVSAFGGMAIYRTADYLAGTYDGSDCEHVPFHASIARATGRSLYLCPSMRTVMAWAEVASEHQHG